MGYYADFEFALTIPAKNVAAAEEVICREYAKWNPPTTNFCEMFNDMWGEDLAEEKKLAPLESLASGKLRGPISIIGHVNRKWRDWEEPLLDALAPFIDAGGEIEVKGEDFDAPSVWVFNGEARLEYEREPVRCDYLRELEAKAKRLEKAESLLRLVHKSLDDTGAFRGKVAAYLSPPPLEELAKAAE